MYITAHKVTNPNKHIYGINSFLHIHRALSLQSIDDWTEEKLDEYTQEHVGELVFHDYEIAPGGNTVLSYIDVIARDSCTMIDLVQALEKFIQKYDAENMKFPLFDVINNIAIRYSMVIGLHGREIAEYFELSSAIQRIYRMYERKKDSNIGMSKS